MLLLLSSFLRSTFIRIFLLLHKVLMTTASISPRLRIDTPGYVKFMDLCDGDFVATMGRYYVSNKSKTHNYCHLPTRHHDLRTHMYTYGPARHTHISTKANPHHCHLRPLPVNAAPRVRVLASVCERGRRRPPRGKVNRKGGITLLHCSTAQWPVGS